VRLSLSYRKVDIQLLTDTGLILIDSLPPGEHASPVHLKRYRTRFRFPHACAGNGLDIPELLEESNSSLYESLKVFARNAWRTEILCGEQKLPPTYEDHLKGLSTNGAPVSYTALNPQAFLVMLSRQSGKETFATWKQT
jgi:hypothetical protein